MMMMRRDGGYIGIEHREKKKKRNVEKRRGVINSTEKEIYYDTTYTQVIRKKEKNGGFAFICFSFAYTSDRKNTLIRGISVKSDKFQS